MKCQILCSRKNKTNITNLSSAELAKRMVQIKHGHMSMKLPILIWQIYPGGWGVSAPDWITRSGNRIPLEVEFSSWLNGTSLHRALYYHPSTVLIWLKCWKGPYKNTKPSSCGFEKKKKKKNQVQITLMTCDENRGFQLEGHNYYLVWLAFYL